MSGNSDGCVAYRAVMDDVVTDNVHCSPVTQSQTPALQVLDAGPPERDGRSWHVSSAPAATSEASGRTDVGYAGENGCISPACAAAARFRVGNSDTNAAVPRICHCHRMLASLGRSGLSRARSLEHRSFLTLTKIKCGPL